MASSEEKFPFRLRKVADRAGGVNAVAAAVGVTPGAVYGWLGGAQPYRRTILKLCTKLGISEQWLIDGNGAEESHTMDSVREPSHTGEGVPATEAEQFDDFMRRAEMRLIARPPQPVRYNPPKPPGKKRKP